MGGYGGGGMVPAGEGRRPETGFAGPAFDEDRYVDFVPKLSSLRRSSGPSRSCCTTCTST
ncbi:MAG: hypothetical protein U0599_00030 [Vicinamibacteria bacterium]